MSVQERLQRAYKVTVRPVAESAGAYRLSYTPRSLRHADSPRGAAKRRPEFTAMAQVQGDEILVRWEKEPSDPEATREDFDQDVRARVGALEAWIKQLTPLVLNVRKWAEELDWATRIVDKPLEDDEIGDYRAPGLLLQHDMTRVGLDPISRATSEYEGMVDLYRLPAYDDIARLFFYDDRWHLYFADGTSKAVEAKPLTRKAFRDVLDAITRDD